MSFAPTAVTSVVEISVTSSDGAHNSPRAGNQLSITPTTTPQNNKNLLSTDSSPISRIRLSNRKSPTSPFAAANLSVPCSTLASPYTEPRRLVQSIVASPNKISSVGANLVAGLIKAATSGDVEAQFNLAMSYSYGQGLEQNFEKALEWFLKCANQGNAKAQYFVGVMNFHGHGTEVNLGKAAEWFRKSANQGDTDAQCDLGTMYLQGLGVDINESEAVIYFKKAAEHGHAEAQFNLAVLYENGDGVDKDVTKAIALYCNSAEQGDSDAQVQLESLFIEGLSTDEEKTDTFLWYQKEAEKNVKFAQKALVKAYSLGIGVCQDVNMAAYWAIRTGLEKETTIKFSVEHFDLIKYIPSIFKNFLEFSKIEKFKFEKGYLSNENFASISELIHSNKSIELFNFQEITLENADALEIIKALKVNSTVTNFFYDGTNVDVSLNLEISKLVNQNNSIYEAKKYAKNHSLMLSSALSNEMVTQSLETMIISKLKSEISLSETKQAVDKFLEKFIQIQLKKAQKNYLRDS